jgi:hypothetical protein
MEDPVLKGGSDLVVVEEIDDRDISNDYPGSFGRGVTSLGINISERQHDWPGLLPSREIR